MMMWVWIVALAVASATGFAGARQYYLPQIELEQTRVEALSRDVTAQNDALDALREQADRRAVEAQAAISAATEDAKRHEVRAQQILARQKPASATECQAVVEILREGLPQ